MDTLGNCSLFIDDDVDFNDFLLNPELNYPPGHTDQDAESHIGDLAGDPLATLENKVWATREAAQLDITSAAELAGFAGFAVSILRSENRTEELGGPARIIYECY
ncbi:hypothetical protein F4820DRAFT_444611 [Hypoxylon rubiginosum]|uniref:Uncharacterized protein n=1 Tax=Hypoxylon rubiginosum TaxID=110542 RepID=A0ACB9ZDT9_9PEZI|nr:hypothetical protein F4820DRAFT_444611 [Hypoxylon rubiginosum]